MSCCGKKREQAAGLEPRPGIEFENIGPNGVTVIGPVSRRSYFFDRPGARATVDARDRQALARVPMLKRV